MLALSFVEMIRKATVARKPGHRGEHEVSRKPLRGESRNDPVEPVVHSCAFCAHDRGCNRHPAFPAPSVFKEGEVDANLGRVAPRECERISSRCLKFESGMGSELRLPSPGGGGSTRLKGAAGGGGGLSVCKVGGVGGVRP